MTEDTYKQMKQLVLEYEQEQLNGKVVEAEKPYIYDYSVDINAKYNPNYGDDRECECGHPYYRHFDTYEDMEPVGCKYCRCYEFVEKKDITVIRAEKITKIVQNLNK